MGGTKIKKKIDMPAILDNYFDKQRMLCPSLRIKKK